VTSLFDECDEEDRLLLKAAVAWLRDADAAELRGDWPRRLGKVWGIDFATAALFVHVRSRDGEGDTIGGRFDSRTGDDSAALKKLTVAVAPGAFYREHAWTEADGAAIRAAASALECATALIPTASIGTLSANADAIISWLRERADERIVLVSLSKGGADVKAAMAHPQAGSAFRSVIGWINVGGTTDGSPMVAWLLARPWATLIYRFLFWKRGRDFQFIRDMDRREGGSLDFELRLPSHVRVLHIVGFPLRRHLRNKRAAAWHRRLAPWGPNDGAAILADACRLPGAVLPVWGADHFSKDRLDLPALVAGALSSIVAGESGGRPADHATTCGDASIENREHVTAGAP
jgi:hypothetical protein